MSRLPLIGVTACSKQIGLHAYHISGDKYVRAVAVAAKGLPPILPSLAELPDPSDILDGLDGLLFTGSPSNLEAHLYGGPASAPGTAHDSARDRSTLHPKVHEVGTFIDHREDESQPLDVQYGPAHAMPVQTSGNPTQRHL